jgi:hypothetical protein
MNKPCLIKNLFAGFRQSRRALAIPATFLILFVTMIGMISITYYFSIEKVNAQSQTLKISAIKQDMFSLDDAILSVLWEPGSSRRIDFGNMGGELNVNSSANDMLINITDGDELSGTIFNETIGEVAYKLPYAPSLDTGVFLKGESRTIINQTGSGITQLSVSQGISHPEVQLRYRPIVTYTNTGLEGNLPVNNLRVYVVKLNSSDVTDLMGAVSLKISNTATQTTTTTYTLSRTSGTASITCTINQETGQVVAPLESTVDGCIVRVDVIVCRVELERTVR